MLIGARCCGSRHVHFGHAYRKFYGAAELNFARLKFWPLTGAKCQVREASSGPTKPVIGV
jgi:hypothetical protein